MKVIFAGTPEFSATVLQAIHQAGFDIPLVLTQPDRPKGRGMKLQASPVKQTAQQLGLNIAQPEKLRHNETVFQQLQALQADVMVVVAYGLILPAGVLNAPKHGCLNIHASLLPRWRGAAPIQRAIEADDSQTGVCIMQMDEGLDTGDIISEHPCPITPQDTAQTVHDKLMHLGANAIVQDLRTLQNTGQLKHLPQKSEGITYAEKINKEQAKINWQRHAHETDCQIRAFNPVPTAWTIIQNQTIKIWQAHIVAQSGPAGQIIALDSTGITVACGTQALKITELQPAGGKKMSATAFLAGHPLQIGEQCQ